MAVLRDLRRSGIAAMIMAVSIAAVLMVGAVSAVVREAGGGTASSALKAAPTGTTGWVRVMDRKVGFIDRLPSQPVDVKLPSLRIGPYRFARWFARTADPVVYVERDALPDLSTGSLVLFYKLSIRSLARTGDFKTTSEHPTSFDNQLAREGTLESADGRSVKAIVFVDGAGDMYLIATAPQYFDSVIKNFEVFVPPSRPLFP